MPKVFQPTPEKEFLATEFAAKSKRMAQKAKSVQLRVLRSLSYRFERSSRKFKSIQRLSSHLRDMIYGIESESLHLAKDYTQYRQRNHAYKKAVKLVGLLQTQVATLKDVIIRAENTGSKIFVSFRPTTSRVYKQTNLERRYHILWKNLSFNGEYLAELNLRLEKLSSRYQK
ncbi:MAG TPA: hypothetical protein VJG83_06790 [archaeon]|nr:hypothetical protein [archaeon]